MGVALALATLIPLASSLWAAESPYQATLVNDAWTILGDSERFTGAFNDHRTTLTGTWERLADGATWIRWMTITLTKAT